MFENTTRKIKEKKYLKEYKTLNNKPFCFQYDYFKELKEKARKDFLKNKISYDFYCKYFLTGDFREIMKTI
jgi:hypothetical protein